MDGKPSWKDLANAEMLQAEQARREGNEGKARVCARRAAGHIIGEYLSRSDLSDYPSSVYGRIQFLISLTDIPTHVQEMARSLLVRITSDHQLPEKIDLIELTRRLSKTLLDEEV